MIALALLLTLPAVADVAGAAAEENRTVDRVVVFADRAEVTRAAQAVCKDGAAAATFTNLPESIDPRTLRGDASGDAVAVGVSSSVVPMVESLDEHVRALRKDILEIDDQLAVLRRKNDDDGERIQSIKSYGTYFRALASEEMRDQKPDLTRWDQLLDLIRAEDGAAVEKGVARSAEERTLARKRERLANRLQLLSPAQAPAALSATVAVRCGSSANVQVRLSYVVPGATWSPEYDLRFTGPAKQKIGEGRAAVTVAGVVKQSTGEDWSNAEVWLSTAKPLLGGEAPLPNPIYVHGAEEQKTKTLVQAQEHRADDLKTGKNTGATGAQGAELEDGGKAFVLKLPKRVTVHADGRPYWFPVDELSTAARSSLVAEPAFSPYVFQVASLSNPAAYPLMAGKVHVFRGPTFVGDVGLDYKGPGESMEISLGVDEEVALERQDLLKQKREAGLFSGSQSIAHAWRTILHNRSNEDLTIEVREQVPVSKSADISVVIDADKTAPGYALDKARGHLTWKASLKQGATDKRDIAFTIQLPKEWTVQ